MAAVGKRHPKSVDLWEVCEANDETAQLLVGGRNKLLEAIVSQLDGEVGLGHRRELNHQLIRVSRGNGSFLAIG